MSDAAKPRRRTGKPSLYTPELADEICARMAQGESLREICKTPGMPTDGGVRGWVIDDRDGFAAKYHRARELQVEYWADEILEIADDGSNDWMTRIGKKGVEEKVVDQEHINRSRLRVDSRKWLMTKLHPTKYGDKQQHAHTGADGGPIEMTVEQRQAAVSETLAKAFGGGDGNGEA